MKRRIFICGPSSAGKTTLAKYIAKEFNVPYIFTDGAALRSKFGYNNHLDIIRASFSFPTEGFEYQSELFKERKSLIVDNNEFVMDRSPIDNIVYFLLQCSPVMPQDVCKAFIDDCKALLSEATHIIVLKSASSVENDNVRIVNNYYQGLTDGVFYHVINNIVGITYYNSLLYPTWNWKDRINEVNKFLK